MDSKRSKDKKVLVIDDQRDSLLMLKHILQEMKYEDIEFLTSAEQALKLIESRKSKPLPQKALPPARPLLVSMSG